MTYKKKYTVCFLLDGMNSKTDYITIEAENAPSAWDIATYEEIPKRNGHVPYAAWVEMVTYKNGKTKRFNTFCGKPY